MSLGGLAPLGGFAPLGGVAAIGASSGLPEITWNGKSLTIPDPVTECNWTTPDGERIVNRSAGPCETLTIRTDVVVALSIKAFVYDQYDLQRRIRAWWEWAKAGKPWTFARYGNRSVLTTLASSASLGASTLTLTDASGVEIGGQYVLRDDVYVHVVEVADVAGNVVTLDEGIDFAFTAGATFRDEWFWPGRIVERANYPVIEVPSVLWDFKLEFTEARS